MSRVQGVPCSVGHIGPLREGAVQGSARQAPRGGREGFAVPCRLDAIAWKWQTWEISKTPILGLGAHCPRVVPLGMFDTRYHIGPSET